MILDKTIYFDNAATTKVNKDVLDFFNKIENEYYANPNSIHQLGVKSNLYLDKARESILKSFSCPSHQIIFTSSSSEANNLAIKGYCLYYKKRGSHIITSNVEHPSVLECFYQLRDYFGFEITILNVNEHGVINTNDLNDAIKDNTILVSLNALNNEIGSINPINEIIDIVAKHPKIKLHVDTTQAIGKIKLPYDKIDMFVCSSHKLHGVKGSGCLVYKKTISFLPLVSGGGQEYGFRSGTQSIALSCALAKAIKLTMTCDFDKKYKHALSLNTLIREQLSKIDGISFNSDDKCSPYIFNFSLTKKKASVVTEALSNKNIFVSSLSACHSKGGKMSVTVKAINKSEQLANNTIRVSFDESNNEEEVTYFACNLKDILESIK